MKFLRSFLIIFSLSAVSETVKTDHAEISIIGNNNIISKPGIIDLGYKFKFTPGWHTYWINPGDSGGPPTFNSTKSDGWEIDENKWPGPEKIEYPPLMTYGYVNEVVFPFKLNVKSLQNQESDITIKFLVCDDICIPEQAALKLVMKNGIINIEEEPELLEKWNQRIPIRAPPDLNISYSSNQISIESNVLNVDSYFFPINDLIIDFSDEQKFNKSNLVLKPIDEFDGNVSGVILSDDKFYSVNETISMQSSTELATIGIFTAVIFAFLGGLILNLMPCVLPVIALKGLSLVKSANESKSSITLNAGAYVAGVILTFMAIATILVSLKNAGEVIGWGYQLQNPIVVTILGTLIFGIGVYLITDLSLGSGLGKLDKYINGSGLTNSFFTGTLSVIVASPCTAPFMGAALGFALIQPHIYSYLVFLFLALGFALPYFLIALFPSIVDFLPRPGKWMESLKQFFGFLMFATALWLLWVLANQVDANSIFFVLILWFSLSFIVWLHLIKFRYATIIGLFLSIFLVYQLAQWDFSLSKNSNEKNQQSWTLEKENELRATQESYFINFTAAWCITCKVNEAVAFTDNIFSKFDENNITYLEADWTNRNIEIAKQIEKYNRSGIPLYVYWNNTLDEPIVLNEILTEGYLMEVIDEN